MEEENVELILRNDASKNTTEKSITLLSILTPEYLTRLRSEFMEKEEHRRNQLSENDFIKAVHRITDSKTYEHQAKQLYRDVMAKQSKQQCLSWEGFLDYIIQRLHWTALQPLKTAPSIYMTSHFKLLTHNRRETTAKIISIAASSCIHAFISKLGVVGILDRHLKLQNAYIIDVDDVQRKRLCPSWVTDAIHMLDCKKLAIGSTNRTMHFYDISAATHMEEFRLFGLPDSATCFAYWFDEENEENGSMLFFGDDAGNVHLLHFKQPQSLLFRKVAMEGLSRVFFLDLHHHKDYVSYKYVDRMHNDAIVRIQYLVHNQHLITCSDDVDAPLVIRDLQGKLKSYVFKAPKGIRCFDFHRPLHLLVTGSGDCLVRFWNPYVTGTPSAVLQGHRVTVIDVRIVDDRHLVISYSRDKVLKMWDITNHTCLQTLPLQFPPLARQLGLDPDHGPFPLHFQPYDTETFLVACKDYLAELKFSSGDDEVRVPVEQNEDYELQVPNAPLPTPENGSSAADSRKPSFVDGTSPAESASDITGRKSFQQNKAQMRTESEALDEFASYIFAKLRGYEGHVTRKEMRELVRQQGLVFRSLKVCDPDAILLDPHLPMSERMRQRGLAFTNEEDFLSLNLNFVGSPTLDGNASRRSSVSSCQPPRSPLPLRKRGVHLPPPSTSNQALSRASSTSTIAEKLLQK